MTEFLSEIPELIETELYESVTSRSASISSFRELGPVDLVQLAKTNPARATKKNIGHYHFMMGMDLSSPAIVAAYLNTLNDYLVPSNAWFRGKNPSPWKITAAIYCSYNPFSRVDMRIEVNDSDSVESFAITDENKQYEATPELWQETYLASVVRSLLLADDVQQRPTSALKSIRPINTKDDESKFLNATEKLFFKGFRLGAKPGFQAASSVNNHLVDALFVYFETTGRWEMAIELFRSLANRQPEVTSLLIRALIGGNREIEAFKLAKEYICEHENDVNVLLIQIDLMLEKNELEYALNLANRAVNLLPSELIPWIKLATVYAKLNQINKALLCLNSAPINAVPERDMLRIPKPAGSNFPIPAQLADVEHLPEIEYKAGSDLVLQKLLKLPATTLRGPLLLAYQLMVKIGLEIGWDELLKYRSEVFVMEEEYRSLRKGTSKSVSATVSSSSIENPPQSAGALTDNSASDKVSTRTEHKRLCERWLDNLFMIMYEDLRHFTVWRAEVQHFREHKLNYEKSAAEWSVLGELAFRLNKYEEATDAFSHAVRNNFSYRAWLGLITIFDQEQQLEMLLIAASQLMFWYSRWYQDWSPIILKCIRRAIEREGLLKIKSVVIAANVSEGLQKIMESYLKLAEDLEFDGRDL